MATRSTWVEYHRQPTRNIPPPYENPPSVPQGFPQSANRHLKMEMMRQTPVVVRSSYFILNMYTTKPLPSLFLSHTRPLHLGRLGNINHTSI